MLHKAGIAYISRLRILFTVKVKHPDNYHDNQQIKKYVLKKFIQARSLLPLSS